MYGSGVNLIWFYKHFKNHAVWTAKKHLGFLGVFMLALFLNAFADSVSRQLPLDPDRSTAYAFDMMPWSMISLRFPGPIKDIVLGHPEAFYIKRPFARSMLIQSKSSQGFAQTAVQVFLEDGRKVLLKFKTSGKEPVDEIEFYDGESPFAAHIKMQQKNLRKALHDEFSRKKNTVVAQELMKSYRPYFRKTAREMHGVHVRQNPPVQIGDRIYVGFDISNKTRAILNLKGLGVHRRLSDSKSEQNGTTLIQGQWLCDSWTLSKKSSGSCMVSFEAKLWNSKKTIIELRWPFEEKGKKNKTFIMGLVR